MVTPATPYSPSLELTARGFRIATYCSPIAWTEHLR